MSYFTEESLKMMMNNRDLFEELRDRVQCAYISDLRYNPWLQAARKEITKMDLGVYGLNSLKDAAEYLYGEQIEFSCVEEAVAFFKKNQPRI